MDPRRARERVNLTDHPLLSTSERALPRLQLQRMYRPLLGALRKVYGSPSPNPSDPLSVYPGARSLLEERYSEEGTAAPSPEDALNYLLDAAIDRFGHSARDVFGRVFNYLDMTQRHKDAFDLNHKDLRDTVSALSNNRHAKDSISHRILALSPVDQGPLTRVSWNVEIKPDWVSRNIFQGLGEAEDDEIYHQISIFQNISGARGIRISGTDAHRRIANATGDFWPLTNMKPNDATDAPHFTLDRDSPVQDNVRFIKVKQDFFKLQSIAHLSTCLNHNAYYVPTDPNFPLFDAFTIEIDVQKKFAIFVDTPDDHVTNARRLYFGLSEDPRNYCDPEGQTSGGPSAKEEGNSWWASHFNATRGSTLPPCRSERRIPIPESAVAVSERVEPE